MKKGLAILLAIQVFVFLNGAFVCATFDITNWSGFARFMCVLVTWVISIPVITILAHTND